MKQYSKVFKSIRNLPPGFYSQLDQNAQCLFLKKGDLIKTVGQDSHRLLFIEKGIVRGYLREYHETYWFKKENNFIFLIQENDKQLGLEILEDGILWEFTGSSVTRIEREFPSFTFHLMYLLAEETTGIQQMTPLERRKDPVLFYDYLRQESQDLCTGVSPAHLASLIGVSEKEFAHLNKSDLHIPMTFARRRPRKK